MTAGASAPDPQPTRRERQRQATYDEIVEVSRRLLLSSEDGLSLRAVAAEMGMTPPALYRYVDSYAELLGLVARAVFQDVVASMAIARDAHPHDDPAAQITAAAAAFRRWALGHRAEFRLVFATPLPEDPTGESGRVCAPGLAGAVASSDAATSDATGSLLRASTDGPTDSFSAAELDNGADMFAAFFSEIFGRLWAKYQFHVPTDDELDPDVLHVLQAGLKPHAVTEGFGSVTPGMVWTFERCWARLYGTVTLEVFGHIHPEFTTSGVLFAATMQDIGRDLGIGDEWERLRGIARTT